MKRYGQVKGFAYRAQQPLPEPHVKMLRCTACGERKPLSEFVWNGHRHRRCFDCTAHDEK